MNKDYSVCTREWKKQLIIEADTQTQTSSRVKGAIIQMPMDHKLALPQGPVLTKPVSPALLLIYKGNMVISA